MAGTNGLVYHRTMRRLLTILTLFAALGAAMPDPTIAAGRKWEYGRPHELEVIVRPAAPEVVAGEVATFTIKVRNRTDKTVNLRFETGQRWDLAAFHEGGQIWRWSNLLRWAEVPHSIPVKTDCPETGTLSWQTVDRTGVPLPQGVYKVQGMVMCSPRILVSNAVSIRLLPPVERRLDVMKVKIGSHFEVKVPRFVRNRPVSWDIAYDYNDNRIDPVERRSDDVNEIITFLAKRVGHVTVHLYEHHEFQHADRSLERRTFRVEVVEHD